MLSKLIKYDLKWIFKKLIPIYILLGSTSLLTRILMHANNSAIFNFIRSLIKGASTGFMICLIMLNVLLLWKRFRQNIYGDESYLTHTLPVTKNELFNSKFLMAIISLIVSTVFILISALLCYYSCDNINMIKQSLELTATSLNSSVVCILLTILLLAFLEIIFIVICGYNELIINNCVNNKTKSIIIGIILYVIPQLLTLLIFYIMGLFNNSIMNVFTSTSFEICVLKPLIIISILLYALYIIIYYILGMKLLNKGVNID